MRSEIKPGRAAEFAMIRIAFALVKAAVAMAVIGIILYVVF
jgi:hypothetical protein